MTYNRQTNLYIRDYETPEEFCDKLVTQSNLNQCGVIGKYLGHYIYVKLGDTVQTLIQQCYDGGIKYVV